MGGHPHVFSDDYAVKRCLSRAPRPGCAAQARVALVHTYRGQASCRHRIGSSCGWLLLSSSEQRTTSCTTASFFSQSLFLLRLVSGLPTICRGVWFSSFLGSVPAFAPVELAFTCFPSSRAVMGLELGLHAHFLGSAILSQFARFPRHVAFLRLRLGFVAGVLPSCSGC